MQDFCALVPGWKNASRKDLGDGDELVSPSEPLGPLRRKELELKDLSQELSEMFI